MATECGDDRCALWPAVGAFVAAVDESPRCDSAARIRLVHAGAAGSIGAYPGKSFEQPDRPECDHADAIGRDAERPLPAVLGDDVVGASELEILRGGRRGRFASVVRGNDVDERIWPAERGVDTDDLAVGGELDDRVVVRLARQVNERRAVEHGDRRALRLGSEVDPEQSHMQIMNPRTGRAHDRRRRSPPTRPPEHHPAPPARLPP